MDRIHKDCMEDPGWQCIYTRNSLYSFSCNVAGDKMLAEEWYYEDTLYDLNLTYVFNSNFLVQHESNILKNIQTTKTYKKVVPLSIQRINNIKIGTTILSGPKRGEIEWNK